MILGNEMNIKKGIILEYCCKNESKVTEGTVNGFFAVITLKNFVLSTERERHFQSSSRYSKITIISYTYKPLLTLSNSMGYGTRRFTAAFTRALQ